MPCAQHSPPRAPSRRSIPRSVRRHILPPRRQPMVCPHHNAFPHRRHRHAGSADSNALDHLRSLSMPRIPCQRPHRRTDHELPTSEHTLFTVLLHHDCHIPHGHDCHLHCHVRHIRRKSAARNDNEPCVATHTNTRARGRRKTLSVLHAQSQCYDHAVHGSFCCVPRVAGLSPTRARGGGGAARAARDTAPSPAQHPPPGRGPGAARRRPITGARARERDPRGPRNPPLSAAQVGRRGRVSVHDRSRGRRPRAAELRDSLGHWDRTASDAHSIVGPFSAGIFSSVFPISITWRRITSNGLSLRLMPAVSGCWI